MNLQPSFRFLYGGKEFEMELDGIQTLPGGLTLDPHHQAFEGGGLYWQPELCNLTRQTSLPFSSMHSHFLTPFVGEASLWLTRGTWGPDLEKDFFIEQQPLNEEKKLSCAHGRSSEGLMPYFDAGNGQEGILMAVGWSGQWHASVAPEPSGLRLVAGLPDADFVMFPGERFLLPSVLLLPYSDGQAKAHNTFRRIIKDEFSPLGKGERPAQMPISAEHWGYMPSQRMCALAKEYKASGVPLDVFWVDSGWYGTPDRSDWMGFVSQTGDWREDERTHPDRLRTVSQTAREHDMSFLLWYEPERMVSTHETARLHPHWFLPVQDDEGDDERTFLLNLGTPEGYAFMYNLLSNDIRDIGLDWVRLDFNIHPLAHWQQNDPPGRKGVTEIKYINGLWRLLEQLLAENPRLMIDNCASGGSRLDIEMMKRSVPLWRSDFQCNSSCNPDANQSQMMGCAWWLPHHGAGVGVNFTDAYRYRSTYTGGILEEVLFSASTVVSYEPGDSEEKIHKLEDASRLNREYLAVREFFAEDFYPLMPQSVDPASWAAWQFHDPKSGKGIIQMFRRAQSPMTAACLQLGGLKLDATYRLQDADTGETCVLKGKQLAMGWEVCMAEPHFARLWRYEESLS